MSLRWLRDQVEVKSESGACDAEATQLDEEYDGKDGYISLDSQARTSDMGGAAEVGGQVRVVTE